MIQLENQVKQIKFDSITINLVLVEFGPVEFSGFEQRFRLAYFKKP